MHSFLIVGGTKTLRTGKIEKMLTDRGVGSFDRMLLKAEDSSVGVSSVREFTKKLSLAPFGGKLLAGIIEDAQVLTVEAQNALLKTLEEPSPKAILFLETVNSDLLLPTIFSRCQVISLGAVEQYSDEDLLLCFKTLEQMEKARVGERIRMVDAIATDRDAAKRWVEKAIAACRHELLQLIHTGCSIASPPKKNLQPMQMANLLRRLLAAQKQLATNVTPKLVLDAIFFNS